MKTILLAAALAASLGLGCQGASSKPSAGDPATPAGTAAAPAPAPNAAAPAPGPAAPGGAGKAYATDIGKLCDVVKLSGAESYPGDERMLPIANWLAANLTTAESRQFLVRIQPMVGEQKAEALEAEARRVGLPGCALAAEWRAPAP